ncbi:MAG TPA: endonuclease/exonuclease/phosphatase family protein [Dongiaceae bacterium]|nr:endonuclease/exonuclease/phosphatase family protein [Dongiaceae bacterium]
MSIDDIEIGEFVPTPCVSAQRPELQVVSWNVARGIQTDGIRKFLLRANADLILLQECDRNSRRTGYENVAKDLAQKLGMNYVFGVEFQELGQGSHASPAHHGQATLSRWPLSDPRILRFRRQSRYWHPRWWIPPLPVFQRRIGGRMALVTRVALGGRSILTYNVHLESRNGDEHRHAQLAELLEDSRQYDVDGVVVAAGDFNFDLTHPREASILQHARFENPFADACTPTITTGSLSVGRAIDCILIRGKVTPWRPAVHNCVRASDHYPLSITLQLP